jgi:hypothetical protein
MRTMIPFNKHEFTNNFNKVKVGDYIEVEFLNPYSGGVVQIRTGVVGRIDKTKNQIFYGGSIKSEFFIRECDTNHMFITIASKDEKPEYFL